jgi:hypothetical protein
MDTLGDQYSQFQPLLLRIERVQQEEEGKVTASCMKRCAFTLVRVNLVEHGADGLGGYQYCYVLYPYYSG